MKDTNINMLMYELIYNFSHLLTWRTQTKEEFLKDIRETYSLENPKTALFYAACERSQFDTIRLNNTRTQILFNQ